jgi:hypothetical protein
MEIRLEVQIKTKGLYGYTYLSTEFGRYDSRIKGNMSRCN